MRYLGLLLLGPTLLWAQLQPSTRSEVDFCPDFLKRETACKCFSYIDGAVIECDGPEGPEVVEKLKTANIEIRQLVVKNADIIEV